MKEIFNRILENAKNAHKESIIIRNTKIEDSLFSIIRDTSLLINNFESKKSPVKTTFFVKTVEEEIEKVKKRIPKWFKKQQQINSQILITFLKLSNNNSIPITVSLLQQKSNQDSNIFISNYNQMKVIAERNHAKVFEENNGNVRLWEPVANIIIDEYKILCNFGNIK